MRLPAPLPLTTVRKSLTESSSILLALVATCQILSISSACYTSRDIWCKRNTRKGSALQDTHHVCLAKSETPRLPLVLIVAQYLFARGNESYLTKEVTALEFSRDESSDARMCRARVYEVPGQDI
jgi:hypothetical protein